MIKATQPNPSDTFAGSCTGHGTYNRKLTRYPSPVHSNCNIKTAATGSKVLLPLSTLIHLLPSLCMQRQLCNSVQHMKINSLGSTGSTTSKHSLLQQNFISTM
jgi:hypothetical protein